MIWAWDCFGFGWVFFPLFLKSGPPWVTDKGDAAAPSDWKGAHRGRNDSTQNHPTAVPWAVQPWALGNFVTTSSPDRKYNLMHASRSPCQLQMNVFAAALSRQNQTLLGSILSLRLKLLCSLQSDPFFPSVSAPQLILSLPF